MSQYWYNCGEMGNENQNKSFFSRLFGGIAQKRAITVGPTDLTSAAVLHTGADFGVNVDNQTALRITALYAGIRLISENIASLPKEVRYETSAGMKADKKSPIHRLVSVQPNSYTNAFSFWSCIVTWMKGWGNAYAVIKRNGYGEIDSLHQVHPSAVRITIVEGRKWYKVTTGNPDLAFLDGMYKDSDILHFMELTLDGIKGVNPIIYNASALGKSLATEKFAAEFFKSGGNIKSVLETDGSLGDEAYDKFMQHYSKAAQNFATPLLEYGIKFKSVPVDPIAEQLIQSEILSIQDICRVLNVPPHMVAELSHATFSNIEHQTIQFVQYSLRPVIKRIEMELEAKLFDADDEYDVKFVLDGLLRGDTTARSAYYHNAILDGYLSRNEVRALEGLESKEGLDDYLYPLNTGVVGKEIDENAI